MGQAFSKHVVSEKVPSHGNFVLGVLGGLGAAIFCAVVWVSIAVLTGWQVDILALVVGVFVGSAVRSFGRGSHAIFGLIGVIFTIVGCLAGGIGVTLIASMTSIYDFYGVLTHVDVVQLSSNILTHLSPMMMGVYAIGAIEGYIFSIHR